MKSITVTTNYLIVDNEGTKTTFPKNNTDYQEGFKSFTIKSRVGDILEVLIPFTDIQNWVGGDFVTPLTKESLLTLLQDNTGFKTASGGSGASYEDYVNAGGLLSELEYYESLKVIDGKTYIPNPETGTFFLDGGDTGIKAIGEDGKPFLYEDFTPEQLEALKGDAFVYEDFTPEQIESLKPSITDPTESTDLYTQRWTDAFENGTELTVMLTGDSTFDNSYSESVNYYTKQLAKIGVGVFNNALAGRSGNGWAQNINTTGTGQGTLQQAIDNTPNTGLNTIMFYNFGINDNKTVQEDFENGLKAGLEEYMLAKPDALIYMVTPIDRATNARDWQQNVANDLGLPIIDINPVMDMVRDDTVMYNDPTHPWFYGTMRQVNAVLDKAVPSDLVRNITLEPYRLENYTGTISNLAIVETGDYLFFDGSEVVNANSRRFTPIQVEPNKMLKIAHKGNQFNLFAYDNNGDFIRRIGFSYQTGNDFGLVVMPENCASVRITVSSEGDTYDALNDTPIVEYVANPTILSIEDINAGFNLRQQPLVISSGVVVEPEPVEAIVVSVSSESVTEGGDLVHSVEVTSSPNAEVYTFNFSNDTTESSDYGAVVFSNGVTDNGDSTITVPSGVTNFTVTISTIDDAEDEGLEGYNLSIGGVFSTGSIVDNDAVVNNNVLTVVNFGNFTSSSTNSVTTSDINTGEISLLNENDIDSGITLEVLFAGDLSAVFQGTAGTNSATGASSYDGTLNNSNVLIRHIFTGSDNELDFIFDTSEPNTNFSFGVVASRPSTSIRRTDFDINGTVVQVLTSSTPALEPVYTTVTSDENGLISVKMTNGEGSFSYVNGMSLQEI